MRITTAPRSFFFIAAVITAACASVPGSEWTELQPVPSGAGEILRIAGTVRYLDIEGGQFVIRGLDGTQYTPLELPETFREDGLAVEVEARRRDDMASIGMVGTLIELLRIRRRPDGAAIDQTTMAAPSTNLRGVWTIVSHEIPGVGAMTNDEAQSWHGRSVRLLEGEALSMGNHCDEPSYRTGTIERDAFVEDYRLPPGALTSLAALDRFTALEVSCHGTSWTAPGARLLSIGGNHAMTPWDGVFFELERDRDVRGAGQEPFWRVEIVLGKELRFTEVARPDVVTPMPTPTTDATTGARVYHAVTEANDLRVAVEPNACTDVMSGNRFESTVTVTLNGRTYDGCGGAVHTP